MTCKFVLHHTMDDSLGVFPMCQLLLRFLADALQNGGIFAWCDCQKKINLEASVIPTSLVGRWVEREIFQTMFTDTSALLMKFVFPSKN